MPDPDPVRRAKAERLYRDALTEHMTIETVAKLIAWRDAAQDAAAELDAQVRLASGARRWRRPEPARHSIATVRLSESAE